MRRGLIVLSVLLCAPLLWIPAASTQTQRPNILVIFGDDIGILNVSAYGRGVIGYTTPNIDRIAREGAIFTDYYGQQSCTAGRSAFLTGQVPFRTGLSKVGLPGAPQGLQKEDPTIAELLKPQGYVTGQFGKNHLGDRDEFLPTAHGFDEFFGNLYHLNAEEEPENEDYPKNPEFRKKFGPRGVIKSSADGKIEDTGPLTKKRMETHRRGSPRRHHRLHRPRQESEQAVLRLVQHHPHAQLHACAAGEPQDRAGGVCRWHDRARRPDRTAPRPPRQSRAHRQHDRRLHDRQRSDGLPLAGCRRDAVPRREEHQLGGRLARAGHDPLAGSGQARDRDHRHRRRRRLDADAARSRRGARDQGEAAERVHGRQHDTFKVHLDGYDQSDLLAGKGPSKRREFFYFSDDGDLLAVRYDRLKVHFMVQNATGIDVWRKPFETLRAPIFFDLRSDPTERGQEGMGYNDWWYRHAFYAVPITGDRRQLPRQLQGVPAPPAAGQLHHRQGDRGAEQAFGEPVIEGEESSAQYERVERRRTLYWPRRKSSTGRGSFPKRRRSTRRQWSNAI